MSNRILKESIRMSEEIDALTWFEETFFYRLIVTVDDYGVFPADPVLLMHLLFPKKENLNRKMVEECLKHLEALQLIRRYSVAGKGIFLQLKTWDRHQRIRNSKRKYPGPEEAEPSAASGEDNAAADGGAENSTEGSEDGSCETDAPEPDQDESAAPVILLPLNDGSEYGVSPQELEEYASLYPAVDVLQELRSMRGWCLNNETRRKTRNGIRRFVNSWMARVQDRGGSPGIASARVPSGQSRKEQSNPYLMMLAKGDCS